MLLAIDVGNTNTVLAVFDGDQLLNQWRLSTDPKRTEDQYALALFEFLEHSCIDSSKIADVIVACVVPQVNYSITMLCKKYLNTQPVILGKHVVDIGIDVKVDNPGEVGADRLVNAVAASRKYGGDCIVIDFGTATNFDVVDSNGDYIGGVISPGINLSLDALHAAAAKLPEVAIARPEKAIGTSTITAMQSGVYFGYIGLIDGIVSKIKAERGSDMKVIATGGLSGLFFSACDVIDEHEPDLTIEGLREIFCNIGLSNDSEVA